MSLVGKYDGINSVMHNINWINGQYGPYTQPFKENKSAYEKKERNLAKKEFDKMNNTKYFSVSSKAINVKNSILLSWHDSSSNVKESQTGFLTALFNHLGYSDIKTVGSSYSSRITINSAVTVDIQLKDNNTTNNSKKRNRGSHWTMRIVQIPDGYGKDKYVIFNLESPINIEKLTSDFNEILSKNIFFKNRKSLDLRRSVLVRELQEHVGLRQGDNIVYSNFSMSNKITVPNDIVVDYRETEIKENYNLQFNNLSALDIKILYPIIKGVLLHE